MKGKTSFPLFLQGRNWLTHLFRKRAAPAEGNKLDRALIKLVFAGKPMVGIMVGNFPSHFICSTFLTAIHGRNGNGETQGNIQKKATILCSWVVSLATVVAAKYPMKYPFPSPSVLGWGGGISLGEESTIEFMGQ